METLTPALPDMDLFRNYLQKITTLLSFPKNIHIILGNESCDLDSTVCSLALAYFINENNENKNEDTITLPILNVQKGEFLLRIENCFVLKKNSIDINTLYYRDTLNIKNLIKNSNVKITLVDHHVLSIEQEYLKPHVVGIFDHRPVDANVHWGDNVDVKIKLVGSCATLITEEIFLKKSKILCSSLASILYDAIIFDTIGLSPTAGKVKHLDITMCNKLEEFLNLQQPNHGELFDVLWTAHNDVSNLSPKQLLIKDLKVIEKILIPGLPMLVKDYLKLTGVLDALKEFCTEKNGNIVIMMGLEAKHTTIERDIAFYSVEENCKLLNFIIDSLKKNQELQFLEENINFPEIKYYRQNHKPSRKQILPLVKNCLKEFVENKKQEK